MLKIFSFFIVLSVIISCNSHAGPLTSKGKIGDLMMVMAPTYALGMTVMEKDWVGTGQLAAVIITSQMATEGIKLLQIERRPNGDDWKSFPSGHSAGAFAGATFVHKRYGWRPAILPYAMSLITGWSRVSARAHYWHDVAAGALLAGLSTWMIVDEYKPENISVATDGESFRFGFNFKF